MNSNDGRPRRIFVRRKWKKEASRSWNRRLLRPLLQYIRPINRYPISEKRLGAVAITDYGTFVCFADKFGDVYVVGIRDSDKNRPSPVNKKHLSPLWIMNRDFVVSGSGDSTVRLWDHASGSLLDTCEIGTKAGLSHMDGREDEILPTVTDICATSNGSLVAVAIQSLPGVMLLRCNHLTQTLAVIKVSS